MTTHDLTTPTQSFGYEPGYQNIIDVQFVSRALASGASFIRGTRWTTKALFPSAGPSVMASAYYHYNRSFEALALVEDTLAHVIRQGDSVTVRLAASDQTALDRAESKLRERLPEHTASSTEVPVEFSHWHERFGAALTSRTMTVPRLSEIERNYPQGVRRALRKLADDFEPQAHGRLLLWHGPPGTGKTWALRALASEWRSWCTLRYVSDPERLLNEAAYLVETMHSRAGGPEGDRWRLVVLEDTGEMLSTDAKQRTGQGLSRLLNAVDGLLGQSSQALFLITTNEDLRSLHPAVARPGRCAHRLEFGSLSPEDANEWLAGRDSPATVATSATLAELFAIRGGLDPNQTRRLPIGFG